MTALTEAVAIGDVHLNIDTEFAQGSFPGYVKIDSEVLHVGGVEHRNAKLLTLSSPATAEHDDGATVTYAGNPYDSNFLTATGGGNGEQTIRLLEFPFAFDDDFVNNDYEVKHTVTADCYIVYSAFITLSVWGGDGAATMSWEGVRDGQHAFIEATDIGAGGAGAALPREFIATSRWAMPLEAGDTIGIGVWTEDVLTGGTAKLMVLLAEPA